MMEQKTDDRRVRRTRAQLRRALTQLLAEKDLRSISVRELTDRADINRGTFYAHYRDIYDLMEHLENEFFTELHQRLSRYTPQQLQGDLAPVLEDVLHLVSENRDLLPSLLDPQSSDRFFLRLSGVIFDMYRRGWTLVYPLGNGEEPNYCLSFVVSGMVGLVRSWAQRGFQEPPDAIAALASRLIRSGLQSF